MTLYCILELRCHDFYQRFQGLDREVVLLNRFNLFQLNENEGIRNNMNKSSKDNDFLFEFKRKITHNKLL